MSGNAASLLRQASCVLIENRAILIEGPPGSGKSSLALALIDRGAILVGDDGVCLTPRAGKLWASPPPHTAGLLEIRNLGLVELPTGEGPASLVLRLDRDAPRYIEQAGTISIGGVDLPTLALFPDTPALHLRAHWAVQKYAIRP
ncbi:hypothetical protein GCM10009127_24630 [Alteraurantiacibacter aestuarii]|uniref:HPr kinase/phosphorylase n=1 Tax=Alteraurantiacibacter aestuarii TaxID=650004 RepID=UPI0031D72159